MLCRVSKTMSRMCVHDNIWITILRRKFDIHFNDGKLILSTFNSHYPIYLHIPNHRDIYIYIIVCFVCLVLKYLIPIHFVLSPYNIYHEGIKDTS
jgi:hypothetical protein